MFLYLQVLGLFLQLTNAMFMGPRAENRNVCKTEDCMKSAKRIIDYMNLTANPCEDFYRFSCGTFLSAPGLRDDENDVSFTQLNKKIEAQLLDIVHAPIDPTETRAYHMFKNYTTLCMKHDFTDAREVTYRQSLLGRAGGWPVLGNWNRDYWSLQETLITLRRLGLEANGIFNIYLAADNQHPSRALIHIDQPRFILSRYKGMMLKAAMLLGADPETADHQLADAILLEDELSKISGQDPRQLYNPHSLSQLTDRAGWLDWGLLLSSVLPPHLSLTEEDTLIVRSVDYLRHLGDVLHRHEPLVISNYIMWNAAFSLTYLERNVSPPLKRFPVDTEESRYCLSFLASSPSLTLALNSAYVRKYLRSSRNRYKEVHDMVDRIAHEMGRNIDQLDWIDDQTKSEALHKVSKMKKIIGYPKELEDDSKIEELFAGFTLDAENFTAAMMDLWSWERVHAFRLLQGDLGPDDWRFPGLVASTADAYYAPNLNAMVIPAAIIQWPFFSPDVPAALNYGNIGMIIGHEISHGFDDQGSQYDSEGKLRNWWTDVSKEQFNQKKKCFINQYSRYKDSNTSINVNGTITQGENIADNAGLKLAYRAYRSLVALQTTTEPALPGLEDFTSDQLFFLGMGNIWCSRSGHETLEYMLTTNDHHSPSEFRVNGVSSNLKDFSKAFQCDSDDPMTRAGKCELW